MTEIQIPFEFLALPNQVAPGYTIEEISNDSSHANMAQEESFHIIIKGTINNLPVTLILDTGASKTVLDYQKYKDIVRPYTTDDPIFSSGISENIEVHFGWLDNLCLNGFEIQPFVSGLTTLDHINEIYGMYNLPYVDGLIGNDILIKYQALINYKMKVLIIDSKV